MSHDHDHNPSRQAIRTEALETLLVNKGLLTTHGIDELVNQYENNVGPMNGARMVARAWLDDGFKQRLLEDGKGAMLELGLGGAEAEQLEVLENTAQVHNVVVCTLCSCYPWPVLGLPPTWYKQPAYRSRIVREPRAVLSEFGVELDDDVEVRVWDSSAEVRYMVLPERPANSEHLTEEQLTALVGRDAMIGVAKVSLG